MTTLKTTAQEAKFDQGTSNTLSKVGERLQWLVGRKVTVRVAYAELGQLGSETFRAVYQDTVPLGREYFFIFNIAGRHRLIRTSAVVEIDTGDTIIDDDLPD